MLLNPLLLVCVVSVVSCGRVRASPLFPSVAGSCTAVGLDVHVLSCLSSLLLILVDGVRRFQAFVRERNTTLL